MNKTIIFALVVIISCGGSDVPIEESAINTETTTTTTIQSTTTTISKNKDEFYTTGGVVTFTNEEIKDTFSEFFELKTKDASVVSNEIFHETAGLDLEDCIEVFKDDFANKDWSEEYGVNSIDEWCKRTVTLETEKIFEYSQLSVAFLDSKIESISILLSINVFALYSRDNGKCLR